MHLPTDCFMKISLQSTGLFPEYIFHLHYIDISASKLAFLMAVSPGHMGKGVFLKQLNLTAEEQETVDQGWKDNAFNQFVSDMIGLQRELPDMRHAE